MGNNMVTMNMLVLRGKTHSGSGTQDGAQSHMGSGLGAGTHPGLLGEERGAF